MAKLKCASRALTNLGQELAVGLSKNHFLVHLDLSGNAFDVEGMKAIPKP
jgi:hypothetical protein